MIINELKIHHLRNIEFAHLELTNRFNFIIGPNGSGKTSILEALYLLSCGHSFRTREIAPLVSRGQEIMTVFGRGTNEESISIQKSSHKPRQIKLNQHICHSTSQLAYALPCQVFYSDIFQIIEAGPSVRRSLLDWGMFHVKQEYLKLWKTYNKVLKQRNALLKTNAPYSQFVPWDKQLVELSYQLHNLRQPYFKLWEQAFIKVLSELTTSSCVIHYYKGWDKKDSGKSLENILVDNFVSDKQKTYTQYGAHQADILIESQDTKAKHILSRGQQKIILIALKLAQASLLKESCLFLFDDLSAELDDSHLKRIVDYLSNHQGQYIITSTDLSRFNNFLNQEAKFYTLEAGKIVSRETY